MTTSAKTETPSPQPRPDCWTCEYFSITWDPRRPYSCKLMGFKSKTIPYLEVVSADGRPCLGYSKKLRLIRADQADEDKSDRSKGKLKGRVVNVKA